MTTSAICLKGRQGEFGPTLALAPARDVVYVGRRFTMGGWNLAESPFANPYPAKKVGGSQRAVELYRQYLRRRPDLVAASHELLRGKRLACWCTGPHCHAALLAAVAEGLAP